jgi:5,10-methylenetetrahydromethanopterin reductase
VTAAGICFLDRPGVREQIRLAQKAEQLGYASVWVTETRLARDAISVLGALAAATERIVLGAGVVNTWTRGPALMAMTFATLNNLAPGRVILGLGAYWDPLAWKQGIERRQPLLQLREYVSVVRRLLALEDSVSFEGELVRVRDLRLDLGHGDPRVPPKVPIYIGATGPKMLELAGEIADGVLINGLLSPEHVRHSLDRIKVGAAKAGRPVTDIRAPALINVGMSADGRAGMEAGRRLVTMYLGQQPHIAKASGLPGGYVARVTEAMGGWPPDPAGVDRAMALVGDDVVDRLTVCGTPAQCLEKTRAWLNAGVAYPVIVPVTDNYDEILEVFAPRQWTL